MLAGVAAERELSDYLGDASRHEHGKILAIISAGIRAGAAVEMARALRGDQ